MKTKEPCTPAQLADDAAEALRVLNHATLTQSAAGWEYPGDAYSTVGNLTILADRLTQALGQVESFVGAHEDAGRLRSDHEPDDLLAQRLLAFHGAMSEAIGLTRVLEQSLSRAHQALRSVGSAE
ncbi:hypothetical protein ACW7N6_38620 [Streptomyces sp. UC1A3]